MSDDDTTRIVTRKSNQGVDETLANTNAISQDRGHVSSSSNDEPLTKIFKPSSSGADSIDSKDGFSGDPVVGWLVVVDGPGRGRSASLGYGMNSIGRDSKERVPLDFGDEEISRNSHAMLTYDGKNRKFYVQHGGGINLTYVGDSPVLQVQELKGREIISIGSTKLCFIPFCGQDFDW
ncbi:FHA domain-containing protein [Polynucleobacter sp. 31A-FELB]|uniref:FHA domain-containing protein n=1 Tax=Polynucleobacter sp. 31A-FELB TaxID=2689096 RepID=UPI001C0C63E7|nr:FHA domain-containing protein [Polynucleobacter sp. 31A-FELB]MBU3586393.1 FHA domain-containing protein [Polynucleobacter sp. 31A-FELB]